VRFRAIEERCAVRGCFIGDRGERILPTRPRRATDRTPTEGRLLVRRPRPLGVIVLRTARLAECVHVDEPAHVRTRLLGRTVVEELVLEGLAATAAVHEEILELGEASQVDL
jgi:hypothetical protein